MSNADRRFGKLIDGDTPRYSDASSGDGEVTANLPSTSVKNSIQSQPLASQQHDEFARRLGFESYLALFETSTPLKTGAEGKWMTTSLRNEGWIVWNAANLQSSGPFRSEEEAKLSIED